MNNARNNYNNKYNSKMLTDYMYNSLPQIYRTEDNEALLRRFLEVFSEGGMTPLLNETNNIMDLLDVDKCPSQYLPFLCKMYGYEYSLEIPELFQRRLLKYIVDIYKRKGTKSAVKFIARELTGFDSEIIENKDFDEEQIKITKWDKRFEHYRNFILKLTAPYEDSQLYNKEEIVVKIVNQFLPTNSQVFVITAYWFKEESTITKNSIDELIRTVVQDYNIYDVHNATKNIKESDVLEGYKTYDSYVHAFYGEEDSYLNAPIGGIPLYTNSIVKMRDTVKFATEFYSVVLKYMEEDNCNVISLSEDYILNALKNYSEVDARSYLRYKVEDFEYTSNIIGEVSLDTITPVVETETFINLNRVAPDKIKSVILDLEKVSPQDSTVEINCDIMKLEKDLESYTQPFRNLLDENSKLNISTVLLTNGIFMTDIVREKGKEDKIILL